MSSSGALITLQFGKYANFVGSHFWNFQEIIAGKLFRHEHYPKPRVIIVDEPDCNGGFKFQPDTWSKPRSQVLWEGPVHVMEAPRTQPSTFQSLLYDEDDNGSHANTVEEILSDAEAEASPSTKAYQNGQPEMPEDEQASAIETAAAQLDTPEGPARFTDFLKVTVHPRSVVDVPLLGASLTAGPSGFGGITACYEATSTALEEVEEATRWLAEEADMLEGMQMMCDPYSAWSGVTASVATALADEYPTQARLIFSVSQKPSNLEPCPAFAPHSVPSLTAALATARYSSDCTLVVPMHAPSEVAGIQYRPERLFHTSALTASAIDTATLPFRIAPLSQSAIEARSPPHPHRHAQPVPSCGETTMRQWCSDLCSPAANLACIGGVAAPTCPPAETPGASDLRLSARERRLKGLPPEPSGTTVPASFVSDRLFWPDVEMVQHAELLRESVVVRGAHQHGALIPCQQALHLLQGSVITEGVAAPRHYCSSAMPLPLPLPFPTFFPSPPTSKSSDVVEGSGNLPRKHTQLGNAIQHCPMLTRTAASGALKEVLSKHAASVRAARKSTLGKECLKNWNVEASEAEELEESLLQSAGRYDSFDFSSDDE